MPRFVILEHDHPVLHWDFMLEAGDVLKAWRLAEAPERSGHTIAADPLGDHRVIYLDYEGPISGERGRVARWDTGEYELLAREKGQTLRVLLKGQRIQREAVLESRAPGWVFFLP